MIIQVNVGLNRTVVDIEFQTITIPHIFMSTFPLCKTCNINGYRRRPYLNKTAGQNKITDTDMEVSKTVLV